MLTALLLLDCTGAFVYCKIDLFALLLTSWLFPQNMM